MEGINFLDPLPRNISVFLLSGACKSVPARAGGTNRGRRYGHLHGETKLLSYQDQGTLTSSALSRAGVNIQGIQAKGKTMGILSNLVGVRVTQFGRSFQNSVRDNQSRGQSQERLSGGGDGIRVRFWSQIQPQLCPNGGKTGKCRELVMQISHMERGWERKSSNVPDSTQEWQVLGETVVTSFPRLPISC